MNRTAKRLLNGIKRWKKALDEATTPEAIGEALAMIRAYENAFLNLGEDKA